MLRAPPVVVGAVELAEHLLRALGGQVGQPRQVCAGDGEVAALVGRQARVVQEVTGHDGRVRIGGEEWSARAYDETLVIPAGTTVDVIEIEGATALVYPRE